MKEYEYLVIGGGISGLATLQELKKNNKNVILLEARKELMYNLTMMKFVNQTNDNDSFTGVQFREKLLSEVSSFIENKSILLEKRVFNIDQQSKQVYIINSSKEQEIYKYQNLIVAVGATQILYGRHLLPGIRGARFFTTFQVSEMIEHYPFLPGKKLIVFGDSDYSIETCLAAYQAGIQTILVSNTEITLPEDWPSEIEVYFNSIIKQIYGDTTIKGILLQQDTSAISLEADSLAVDGDFVLEHKWRHHLHVEWDLNKWKIALSNEDMKKRNLFFMGDVYIPNPNFILQYKESAHRTKELFL